MILIGRSEKQIRAVIDELGPVFQAQLVENMSDMGFHGPHGNIQGIGNLPVAVPGDNELYQISHIHCVVRARTGDTYYAGFE
jgi:hypothetical protein